MMEAKIVIQVMDLLNGRKWVVFIGLLFRVIIILLFYMPGMLVLIAFPSLDFVKYAVDGSYRMSVLWQIVYMLLEEKGL